MPLPMWALYTLPVQRCNDCKPHVLHMLGPAAQLMRRPGPACAAKHKFLHWYMVEFATMSTDYAQKRFGFPLSVVGRVRNKLILVPGKSVKQGWFVVLIHQECSSCGQCACKVGALGPYERLGSVHGGLVSWQPSRRATARRIHVQSKALTWHLPWNLGGSSCFMQRVLAHTARPVELVFVVHVLAQRCRAIADQSLMICAASMLVCMDWGRWLQRGWTEW
jgi:hypothetical protein